MEPLEPKRPGPFFRCREENGLPVRLVGESDVFSLPATEEFRIESDSASLGDSARQKGTRARLTSHRFYWRFSGADSSAWLALRLDAAAGSESAGGFIRSRACVLHLAQGGSVAIKGQDAAKVDELHAQVTAALAARRWKEGSYEAAAIGGLQRILAQRDAQKQAAEDTLDLALSDLKSLRQYAADTVAVARRVAQQSSAAGGGGDGAGVQRLLEDCGLLSKEGGLVATGGGGRSDVDADVARVCEAVLEKRGGLGMLLAHDVFCLVNRARGTGLLSPEEVMAALRRSAAPGRKLRLRALGSTGAVAVSLARTSDAEVDTKLLQLAEVSPLSAFSLAAELSLTAAEAQYLLRDAETRAVLVRDDAPDGVFYYRNFFDDL